MCSLPLATRVSSWQRPGARPPPPLSPPAPPAARAKTFSVIHTRPSSSEDGCVRMYEAVDVMDLESWQLAGVRPAARQDLFRAEPASCVGHRRSRRSTPLE